jgi:hypothetical protein
MLPRRAFLLGRKSRDRLAGLIHGMAVSVRRDARERARMRNLVRQIVINLRSGEKAGVLFRLNARTLGSQNQLLAGDVRVRSHLVIA